MLCLPIPLPQLGWERDVQLYLDTFTGVPNSGCQTCSSSDDHADSWPPFPPRSRDSPTRSDLCYIFNNSHPCAHSPCPYKRRCNQPGCIHSLWPGPLMLGQIDNYCPVISQNTSVQSVRTFWLPNHRCSLSGFC